MGITSGLNLWVWLKCIGVVSGCCEEAYRFSHNYYLFLYINYILQLYSFLQQQPYFFVHFLNVVLFLFMSFLCTIANVAQRTITTKMVLANMVRPG